ncbi:MAG: hypothetical protein AAGC93_10325 [Cyanobacteria bacterium P01_F01_bin.53]
MYEVFALFKPEMPVTVKDVRVMADAIAATSDAQVSQRENTVTLESGEAQLNLALNDGPHVAEESNELFELFEVPCEGCISRLEFSGYDPDMVLFNDYSLLIQRLEKNKNVILFDPVEGALLET